MGRQLLELGEQAFLLINTPLILLSLTANIFYASCMIFPPCNRQKLRQPLKMLVGFFVCCSVTYFVFLSLTYIMLTETKSLEVFVASWMIVLCYVHSSMACSTWLNFYFYMQIVPIQRALLIWVKRNIRCFIFTAFFLEEMFILFSSVIVPVHLIIRPSSDINSTWTERHISKLHLTSQVISSIAKLHILSCLCVMTFSSCSTVHYLLRHMRNMTQGGLSSPRIQSLMRVALTGVSQGLLHFSYGIFYFVDSFSEKFSTDFFLGAWVYLTVTSLYISGTTVNVGVGQAIFRQRAADVLRALKAMFQMM